MTEVNHRAKSEAEHNVAEKLTYVSPSVIKSSTKDVPMGGSGSLDDFFDTEDPS